MKPFHRWLLVAAFALSAVLGLVVEPPQPLADWLPERSWQVAVLAIGIWVAVVAILTVFGVLPLKLSLFGNQIELPHDEGATVLTSQLATLRNDVREVSRVVREMTVLIREVSETLVGLDNRVRALERRDQRGPRGTI